MSAVERRDALREVVAILTDRIRTLGKTEPGDPIRSGLLEGYRDALHAVHALMDKDTP